MPESSLISGLNSLGSSLIQGTANAWMTGIENKRAREWSLAMYDRQRRDAISDWERQNAYNSPQAQMGRLKAAGLNPNLFYGNGATAMSSQSVRSSNPPGYSPESARVPGGVGSLSLDQYFDAQIKQAQVDNLKAQNEVIKNEAALKLFQRSRGETMLPYESKLADVSYDVKINQIAQMMNKWEIDQVELEYLKRTKEDRIEKVVEELKAYRLQNAKTDAERKKIAVDMANVAQDVRLKQFDIDLRSRGIHPGTPTWYRALQIFVNDAMDALGVD